MAFPAGVTTATISLGTMFDFRGIAVEDVTAKVEVFLGGNATKLNYRGTGQTVVPSVFTVKAVEGMVSFQLPHVDQPGFFAGDGSEAKYWAYIISIQATPPGSRAVKWVKRLQPLVGQDSIDLDNVVDGELTAFVSTPQATVTSVNGMTGDVWVSGGGSDESIDLSAYATKDELDAAKAAIEEVAGKGVPAGSMLSRGIVPAGADLNTYREPDHAGVWELAASRSYVNSPIPNTSAGLLIVSTQRSIAYQRVIQHGVPAIWERSSLSSSTWNPWNALPVSQPAAGVNLDDLRSNQEVVIRNTTDAVAVTGGWPDAQGIPRVAARISVRATTTGLVFQQMQTYGSDPRFLVRSTSGTSPTPYPFSAWRDLTAPAPVQAASTSDAGMANALLLQDFTRRRPVIKTGGKPAVALRFDHGLGNFRDKVVPALKRLNLKAAQALNGGDWDRAENGGVTASQVNTWVTEGWLEIWNHSLNHVAPPAAAADLEAQIKGGLDKLRADLPAAVIDGYAPPGSSGDTTGFDGGGSIESWWNTAPGRAILRTHAVAAGYLNGAVYRTLDGEVRQGQSHYTLDTLTLDTIKARVTGAYTGARGVALMLHPSRLDTDGYLSSADFIAFLEWLAAERDAGRVVVLGYYDLLRADGGTVTLVESPKGSGLYEIQGG